MTDAMRDAGELLPCPFCGGEGVFGNIEDENSPDNGGHFIQCTEGICAASTKLVFACGDDPKPLLAEAWNRRVAPHTAAAVAEAVRAEREACAAICDLCIEQGRDVINDPDREVILRTARVLGDAIRSRTQEST